MDSAHVGDRVDCAFGNAAERQPVAMSTLRKETARRPRDVSALRPGLTRRRRIVLIVCAVLAIAAQCDWRRPPNRQISVVVYNTIVIKGYRLIFQPAGRYI